MEGMTDEMRQYDVRNIIMMTHVTIADGLLNLDTVEVYDWLRYEMLSAISTFRFEGEELWDMVLSTRTTEESVALDLWGFP
jgi:hypothetical protein